MATARNYVITFESTYGPSGVRPSELAIASVDQEPLIWYAHIEPAVIASDLPSFVRSQISWLSQRWHGIPYSYGHIDLQSALDTVKLYIKDATMIYTTGAESQNYLTFILERDVSNIYKIERLLPAYDCNVTCLSAYHKNIQGKFNCAVKRAVIFAKRLWLYNNEDERMQ